MSFGRTTCSPGGVRFYIYRNKIEITPRRDGASKEIACSEDQTKEKESWHPERQDQQDAGKKHKYASHHASSTGRASTLASGSWATGSGSGNSRTTQSSAAVTTASGFNCCNMSINIYLYLPARRFRSFLSCQSIMINSTSATAMAPKTNPIINVVSILHLHYVVFFKIIKFIKVPPF